MMGTKWDTTSTSFCKCIKETIKESDEYAKIEIASNMDEVFESSWNPGGALVGGFRQMG